MFIKLSSHNACSSRCRCRYHEKDIGNVNNDFTDLSVLKFTLNMIYDMIYYDTNDKKLAKSIIHVMRSSRTMLC